MSSSFVNKKKHIRRIMESDSSDNSNDDTFPSESRRQQHERVSSSRIRQRTTTMQNRTDHNCSSSSSEEEEDGILEYRPFSPSTKAHPKQSSCKSPQKSNFQKKRTKSTATTTTPKRKISSSPAPPPPFSSSPNSNKQDTTPTNLTDQQRQTIRVTRSTTKKKHKKKTQLLLNCTTEEMSSSSDDNHPHPPPKQEKIRKKALRKVQLYATQLPTTRITKCSQLVWYKEYTDKYTTRYHPSRICDPSEAVGLPHLLWNTPQHYHHRGDTTTNKKKNNVLIQFLEYPLVTTTKFPQVVDSQSLVPYYGLQQDNKNNQWCPDLWNKYQKQQKMMTRQHFKQKASRSDLQACFMILQQLLQHAQNQEEQVRLDQQQHKETIVGTHQDDPKDVNSVDSDELDEPYTQALNLPTSKKRRSPTNSDSDSSSSDEGSHPYHGWNGSDKKNKEPLRPGDVITYYSPIFVFGNERGLRTATVLSTDPHRDPILVLDNGEILPNDTHIKRIKIHDGTSLYDHPGIFRMMTRFIMTKKSLKGHGYGVGEGFQIASARVGQILQHHQTKFQQHIQEGGVHGPTDFFRTTKFGKRLSSSSKRVGGTVPTISKRNDTKLSVSSSSSPLFNRKTSQPTVKVNDTNNKRKSTNKKQKGQRNEQTHKERRRHNLTNDENDDDDSCSSDSSSSETCSKQQRQPRHPTTILQPRHPKQGRHHDGDISLRNNHPDDPSSSSSDSETPMPYARTTSSSLSKQRCASSMTTSPQHHKHRPNNASCSKKVSDWEDESVKYPDVSTYPDYPEKQPSQRASTTLPPQTRKHHPISSLQDDNRNNNSTTQTLESHRRTKSKAPAYDSDSESSLSSSAADVNFMVSPSKPSQRLLDNKPPSAANRKKIDPSLNSPYSSSSDNSDSDNSSFLVKVKKRKNKKYSKGKDADPSVCVKMVDLSDSGSSSSSTSGGVKKPKKGKGSRKETTSKTKFPPLEIQRVVSHKHKIKGRSSTSRSGNSSKDDDDDDDKDDDDFLKRVRQVATNNQKSSSTLDHDEKDDDSVGKLSSAKMSSIVAGPKHSTNSNRGEKKIGLETTTSSSSGTLKTKKSVSEGGFSLSLTKHNTTSAKKARTPPLKSRKRGLSLSTVREKRESLSFSSDSDNSAVVAASTSSEEPRRHPSPVGEKSEGKQPSKIGSVDRDVVVGKSHDELCSPAAHKSMNRRIAKKADESLTDSSKKEMCFHPNGSAKKTPLKRKRLSDTTNSSVTNEYTPRTQKQKKRKDGAVKVAVGKENLHDGEPTSQLSFDASMSESSLPHHDYLRKQDHPPSSKKKTKKSTPKPKSSAGTKRSGYTDSDDSLDGGRWMGKKSFKKKKDVSGHYQNNTNKCSSPDQAVVRESIDTLLEPPPSSGRNNHKKIYGRRSRVNRNRTTPGATDSSSAGRRRQVPIGMVIIPGNSFRS